MSTNPPDVNYVNNLLTIMKAQLEGLHKKMAEIERLRYYEDPISLPDQEKTSGLELRIGLTAELIDNVKASMTTNLPICKVNPLRIGTKAAENAEKRQAFWNAYIEHIMAVTPVFDELADSVAGLGLGYLKATYLPWPKPERRRKKGESDKDYLERQDALKRFWGPPFRLINIHPLSMYCRPRQGARLTWAIENSWKQKGEVYPDGELQPDSTAKVDPELLAAAIGHPEELIQGLPAGTSQADLVLATEYWNGSYYQIYVNNQQVHNEENPAVCYFLATGRSSSSKDPDKLGLSVAENLRNNEPIINRTLTRMAEAADLLVRKRLTLELPEGATAEEELDENNNPVARVFKFEQDGATALPPGAKTVDPFAGSENVYEAMPFVQLLMQMAAMHGVSPIFKGQSPGAAGSGYRDTSLYMMAMSQFKHIINSYAACISEAINWLETCLVTKAKQRIWVGDLSLDPSDVADFPAVLKVTVEPVLPQNDIADGHFWDFMWSKGHVPRSMVLQKGLKVQDSVQIAKMRLLEDLQGFLTPVLLPDVLESLGLMPQGTVDAAVAQALGMEGSSGGNGGGDLQTKLQTILKMGQGGGGASAGTGPEARQIAGLATGGQSKQPSTSPGSYPPGAEAQYQQPSLERGEV